MEMRVTQCANKIGGNIKIAMQPYGISGNSYQALLSDGSPYSAVPGMVTFTACQSDFSSNDTTSSAKEVNLATVYNELTLNASIRAITPLTSQEVLFTLGFMNSTQRDVIFMHVGLDNSGNFIKSPFLFKTWYPGSLGMKFDTRMMGVSVAPLEQNLLVTLADMTNIY